MDKIEYQNIITQIRYNKHLINLLNEDISRLSVLIKEKSNLINRLQNNNYDLDEHIKKTTKDNKQMIHTTTDERIRYNDEQHKEESIKIKLFNEKYHDYIVDNHSGLCFYNESVHDYLEKTFDEKLIHIKGFKFYQIKMKFGRCRFYTNLFEILGENGNQIETNIENKINNIIYENRNTKK